MRNAQAHDTDDDGRLKRTGSTRCRSSNSSGRRRPPPILFHPVNEAIRNRSGNESAAA